jgi:2'-5' RNA ligase
MVASGQQEGERGERSRIFIALDLPADVLAAIAAWQRRALHGRDAVRAIDPGALHVTLSFLGSRDAAEVDRARGALMKLQPRSPVSIRLAAEPLGLPRRRPRVMAFDAESAAAVELQRTLVARLAEAGLIDEPGPGGRRFRPHLSVARIRGDPRDRRLRRGALAGLPPLPDGEGHTFDAVRVALYRSELRSQGARYSLLADVELPRRSGG